MRLVGGPGSDSILKARGLDTVVLPDDGVVTFICGEDDSTATCGCAHLSGFLCDWPVGDGKTCDIPLCKCCRRDIGPNKDVCEIHWHAWKHETGGMPIVPGKPTLVR